MRIARGIGAVAAVMAAAFGAQAWAASRGHSLGGIGLLAFAFAAAGAWTWATRPSRR